MGSITTFPPLVPIDVQSSPKLNGKQAGHIRHFHNLASLPDSCWNHLWSEDALQESMDAYRYQLANLVYAASVAHYHRLPALRSVFKPMMRRFIQKMLLRDVWGYWYNTSQSGTILNPDLKEPRKPWADPVVRENIMYSGHLLLMLSFYAMLFDDDEFEQPDSVVFDWAPQFWGESEKYKYSTQTLQDVIVKEMEKNQFLGACCEPNVVFVICNQFPLIAIGLNDKRHGTNVLDKFLPKYLAAWEKKGMIGPTGLIAHMWMVQQDQTIASQGVTGSAWNGAFMNAWNSEFVYSLFEKQKRGHITKIDGQIRLQTFHVGNKIRRLVEESPDKHDYDSAATVAEAVATAKAENRPIHSQIVEAPTFGMVLQWLSELGKEEYLSALLEYADEHLNPIWDNGGLFYQRTRDYGVENFTCMDPYTSNSGIGYARLNVHDGQKIMFEKPWTREHLARTPYIDNVDLSQGVDFLRGQWLEDKAAMIITLKVWDGMQHKIIPRIRNLPAGTWGVYVNGQLHGSEDVTEGDSGLSIPLEVPASKELDVVVLHAGYAGTDHTYSKTSLAGIGRRTGERELRL
ncbi:hypothetical protein B0A52_00248 [Exophiala mesophila]|uniref:Linalool dehydratase/isomerase domain-containing protein n=1 Tax=Exophiala mesophila TaxID=212818 RepID=A0A438NJH8_EXOME|nr:hypothetical protein B0A52_00248 [Exophiala mesophila]